MLVAYEEAYRSYRDVDHPGDRPTPPPLHAAGHDAGGVGARPGALRAARGGVQPPQRRVPGLGEGGVGGAARRTVPTRGGLRGREPRGDGEPRPREGAGRPGRGGGKAPEGGGGGGLLSIPFRRQRRTLSSWLRREILRLIAVVGATLAVATCPVCCAPFSTLPSPDARPAPPRRALPPGLMHGFVSLSDATTYCGRRVGRRKRIPPLGWHRDVDPSRIPYADIGERPF